MARCGFQAYDITLLISPQLISPKLRRFPQGDIMAYVEIVDSGSAAVRPTKPLLTSREVQVLRLLADGLSSKDVAARLSISFKTATSHRSNILTKLRVHDTVLAVRWAIRQQIIEP